MGQPYSIYAYTQNLAVVLVLQRSLGCKGEKEGVKVARSLK